MDTDLQIATYSTLPANLTIRVAFLLLNEPFPAGLNIYGNGILQCCRSRRDERAGDWY